MGGLVGAAGAVSLYLALTSSAMSAPVSYATPVVSSAGFTASESGTQVVEYAECLPPTLLVGEECVLTVAPPAATSAAQPRSESTPSSSQSKTSSSRSSTSATRSQSHDDDDEADEHEDHEDHDDDHGDDDD